MRLVLAFFAAICLGALPARATTLFADDFKGVPTVMPDGKTQLYVDRTRWSTQTRNADDWEARGYGPLVAKDALTGFYSGNGELQAYVSPFSSVWRGAPDTCNPFSFRSDGLHIVAKPFTAAQSAALLRVHGNAGLPFLTFCSGILTTWAQPPIAGTWRSSVETPSFRPSEGRPIVIRALVKAGTARGFWPAIWLLPASPAITWPPEIDMAELMPAAPHTRQIHAGLISRGGTRVGWYHLPNGGSWADGAAHKITLVWDVKSIEIQVDGSRVAHWDTSGLPDMDEPMYLIVNAAVGGKWPCNEIGSRPVDSMARSRLESCARMMLPDYETDSGDRADFVLRKLTVDDSPTMNAW